MTFRQRRRHERRTREVIATTYPVKRQGPGDPCRGLARCARRPVLRSSPRQACDGCRECTHGRIGPQVRVRRQLFAAARVVRGRMVSPPYGSRDKLTSRTRRPSSSPPSCPPAPSRAWAPRRAPAPGGRSGTRLVVPRLAESFRVITYDRRGHSQSERPSAQGSIREDVADLAALIEQLGLLLSSGSRPTDTISERCLFLPGVLLDLQPPHHRPRAARADQCPVLHFPSLEKR